MSTLRRPLPTTAFRQIFADWLAFAVLLSLGVLAAYADAATPPDERAGALLLKSAADAAPLEALRQQTRMHATVTGNIARVTVTQTFTNPSDSWMEGLYVFPLPTGSAVDELTMQVGERVVAGEIREREEAHAAYARARSEGRQASLVDQERPNMFTSAVANIAPHATVTVTIAYLDSIAMHDGRYRLVLPLCITPRYTPDSTADTPAAQRGSPEAVSAATQAVAIEVDLEPGFALAELRSLNHAVTQSVSASGTRVTLVSSEAPADRDFELSWKPQVTPDVQAAAFAQQLGEEAYLLLLLTPPQMTTRQAPPREVIFIIDTSGSMEGPSIEQARAALRLGVARLRPVDQFNVIRFSNDATQLFMDSQAATAASTAAAGRFIDGLTAGGGTEMKTALQLALATPPSPQRLRQIVFITDGSVGNEDELVHMIHARIGSGRLFTVGIGVAPNAYFMHAAAAAGRGSYTFIGNREEVQGRMEDLFQKLEQPALTDLTVHWPGGLSADLAAPLPADVYAGDPLVIAARLPRVPQGLLTLMGNSEGQVWSRQVQLTPVAAQSGIDKLWARERIGDLTAQRAAGGDSQALRQAILRLALAHHLVSDYTSLVAVDVTPLRAPGADVGTAQIATAAPQGSYWAGTTGFARTATRAPQWFLAGAGLLTLATLVTALSRSRAARRSVSCG